MKNLAGFSGVSLALSFLAVEAHAQSFDPCDFASSGKSTFSYAQVMSCYQRVPFSSSALDNIVRVVKQHRSFSDLGEIYDARVHWRDALDALVKPEVAQRFSNDLAMHDALKREHKNFRNPHVAYMPPACYWSMLNAFVPLEFGSVVRHVGNTREQVVFVEAAPILPELYQAATGIDANAFVGLRVVSINGVPVLDYFRHYAEQQRTHEDAGGGVNGILANFEYSFRLGGPHDFVPEQAEDTYVFESAEGKRQEVKLPWVFALSGPLLGEDALPPSASSGEFIELCEQGPAVDAAPTGEAAQLKFDWGLHDRVDRHRRHVVQELRRRHHPHPKPMSYFEVNGDQLGKGIQEIIPRTEQARVIQYKDDITAIQLGDTGTWIDVARQGVEYACAHSDRLILDIRNNNGGNDTVIRWLHHYLFPERGNLVPAGLLPLRVRNDNPVLNEILFNFALFAEEYLPALGADPCALGLTPGCLTDVDRGTTLPSSKVDWYISRIHREVRAGRLLSLSQQFGLPNIGNPTFDSASCAGQFRGNNLVLVTNGSNASGGYFLPAAFKGDGVIVNTGGIVGEPMAMGRARGGATLPGTMWASSAQAIETLSEGQITFTHQIEKLNRPVETNMEMGGAYRQDRRTLHVENPIEADLRVYVWTNLPGSEGFVYDRVLRAVDSRRMSGPCD